MPPFLTRILALLLLVVPAACTKPVVYEPDEAVFAARYVHNGPAYPGYPSAVPMWFHYVNPVSGRVPEYYWPDCATCAAFPETSLEANGY